MILRVVALSLVLNGGQLFVGEWGRSGRTVDLGSLVRNECSNLESTVKVASDLDLCGIGMKAWSDFSMKVTFNTTER